jgi:3-hydroxybutyryl-CoA dehydrogenase
MEPGNIRQIAVIGAGTMGHGIAQDFARGGFRVALHDLDEERVRQAREQIAANLAQQAQWGLIGPGEIEPAMARIETTTSLAAAADEVDLVVEAVFEDLDLKRRVFTELDRLCPPHTILGSNTSSFMPSLLASATQRPERFLVIHYFYPPPLMPLVEIVPSAATSAETVEAACRAVRAAGKTPIVARKEAMGFVVNRLQMALLREAYHIVAQDIASAADVDLAVRQSFGRRLAVVGPLELAEVQDGWDVQWEINRHIFPDLDRSAEPSPVIRQKIERGELGPRTGRGFYDWTPAKLEAWQQRLWSVLAGFMKNHEP